MSPLAIPLSDSSSDASMGWRAACVCGMASGMGFGISEAVTYSSHYYNGIMGAEIYWVRFVSCVALHGLWTGGAAIIIFRRQKVLENSRGGWDWFMNVIFLLIVPMTLHGLYDTLLKKHDQGWALLIAAVTMAWFSLQVEWAMKTYGAAEEEEESSALPAGA